VEHTSVAPPRVEEVSTGIYADIQPDGSWFLNTTGFLVGRTGVVSIDTTSTERRTRAYLRFVQDTAQRGKAAGLSPLELARQTDLGRFAELDGAEPGAPIDTVAALRDMVAYNSGQPLRCLA
jgi:hypothetical protein